MKVNRTYTMELRTLEQLARKKNKSLIVNLAVRRYLAEEENYSPADIPSRQLLAILRQRDDISRHLVILIEHELFHGSQ